jgi:hypothetical protein
LAVALGGAVVAVVAEEQDLDRLGLRGPGRGGQDQGKAKDQHSCTGHEVGLWLKGLLEGKEGPLPGKVRNPKDETQSKAKITNYKQPNVRLIV